MADKPDAATQKSGKFLLGVLIPGAQLVGELVAMATNSGEYRSETIDAMIGEGNIFLLAVVIDENRHIDIDG